MRAKHLFLAVAAVVSLVGCGGSVTSHGIAQVKAVDFLTTPATVDVFTDFTFVATGLTVGVASDYSSQTASDLSVGVRQSGTTSTLASASLSAAVNGKYTVFAYPNATNDPALLILTDDFTAPAAASYKLRFVHADRLLGNVDVYVTSPSADLSTSTPILTNVALGGGSSYIELGVIGQVTVRMTNTGTTTVVGTPISFTPASGSFKTFAVYQSSGTQTVLYADQN